MAPPVLYISVVMCPLLAVSPYDRIVSTAGCVPLQQDRNHRVPSGSREKRVRLVGGDLRPRRRNILVV